MEFLKKYSNWIMVALFALFLIGNMKSCTKNRKIHRLEQTINQKDSVISSNLDSIKTLNNQIQVLQTEISGYEKSLNVQNDALNKISEAKKNINVVVKGKN